MFWQNLLYLGKIGCIWVKWFYLGKIGYNNNNNNNNNSLFDPIMKNTIRNTILENILRYRSPKKNHQGLSRLDDLS